MRTAELGVTTIRIARHVLLLAGLRRTEMVISICRIKTCGSIFAAVGASFTSMVLGVVDVCTAYATM